MALLTAWMHIHHRHGVVEAPGSRTAESMSQTVTLVRSHSRSSKVTACMPTARRGDGTSAGRSVAAVGTPAEFAVTLVGWAAALTLRGGDQAVPATSGDLRVKLRRPGVLDQGRGSVGVDVVSLVSSEWRAVGDESNRNREDDGVDPDEGGPAELHRVHPAFRRLVRDARSPGANESACTFLNASWS